MMRRGHSRAGQGGFATLFIIAMAATMFLLIAGALAMSRTLHEQNRRQLKQVQERALGL